MTSTSSAMTFIPSPSELMTICWKSELSGIRMISPDSPIPETCGECLDPRKPLDTVDEARVHKEVEWQGVRLDVVVAESVCEKAHFAYSQRRLHTPSNGGSFLHALRMKHDFDISCCIKARGREQHVMHTWRQEIECRILLRL